MTTDNARKDLEKRALAEMQAGQQIILQLEFSIMDIMAIVGPLQLALRHPAFPVRNAQFVRAFIQQIKTQLAQYPAICAVIDMGFNPAFDYVPENQVRRDDASY